MTDQTNLTEGEKQYVQESLNQDQQKQEQLRKINSLDLFNNPMTQPALYSFHDALTALTEGRCKGIKAEHGFASYLVLNKDNVLCWWEPETPFLQVHYFLSKWTLVGEKISPQPWSRLAHVHPTARWLFLKDSSGEPLVAGITSIWEKGISISYMGAQIIYKWDELEDLDPKWGATLDQRYPCTFTPPADE